MNSPLVSIIVPVFNRVDIVGETIQSIVDQTYTAWELVLVDDGSTDGSKEALESFARNDSRISYFSRPASLRKGANSCRNYGLLKSRGELIKWVDSDDLLVADALQHQVPILSENKVLQACLSQGVFFNNVTMALEENWSRMPNSNTLLWDYIRNNVRWPIGGPLWKRDFFKILPFSEELMNSQEWLMHGLQLLKLTPEQYTITDDIVYLIRRGNSRMSSTRSSSYFYNQAKSRFMLLRGSFKTATGVRFKSELVKQILIFYYHALFPKQ